MKLIIGKGYNKVSLEDTVTYVLNDFKLLDYKYIAGVTLMMGAGKKRQYNLRQNIKIFDQMYLKINLTPECMFVV